MLDPVNIIKVAGLVGVLAVVFTETGLFFGFFFPGDSLLFTAGLFASQGYINIWILVFGGILAAVLGDSVGYWTGKKWGRKLFERQDSFFFKKKYLYEAENFYQEHGKYTIIIARFIPVVRTFAPIVAGIAKMNYRTFISYNIFGGIFWILMMTLLGYFIGGLFPDIEKHLFEVILLIIFISFLPIIFKIYKNRKNKR